MDEIIIQGMTHASLFTGIGGFDFAAEMMGWTNLFQCEWDPFCNEVLNYRFPHTAKYKDIHEFRGEKWRGAVDVLSGGFPCQPYSNAGKRLGKEDERHLWPQMLRAIREVRPRYVVGENVAGLLTWNGGVVIEEVLSDLEAEGYRTLPPLVIPAAGKGAPHRRDRVWIIAHTECAGPRNQRGQSGDEGRGTSQDWRAGIRQEYRPHAHDGHAQRGPREGSRVRQSEDLQRADDNTRGPSQDGPASDPHGAGRAHSNRRADAPAQGSLWGNEEGDVPEQLPVIRDAADAELGEGIERHDAGQERGWQEQAEQAGVGARGGDASDPSGQQPQRRGKPGDVAQESGSVEGEARKREWGWYSAFHRRARCDWSDWPTQSPLCDGDDGVPAGLVRYTAAEAEALRKQALHAGGNAILPQVAYEIFKAIEACEQ